MRLPQPWAARCLARTPAPLGFTGATQYLQRRYIYQAKKKKKFWLTGVLTVRPMHYLGGKRGHLELQRSHEPAK